MADHASEKKDQKALVNSPVTTCTDIGDGKKLCITISLQDCSKACNQPSGGNQSAGSVSGGESKPPDSGTGCSGGGSRGTGCGTGSAGGGNLNAPSKPKCATSCSAYKTEASATGGENQGKSGTAGSTGESHSASCGKNKPTTGSHSSGCATGSRGGGNQSVPSKPKCSTSCAAYANPDSVTEGGSQDVSGEKSATALGGHGKGCRTRCNRGHHNFSCGPPAGGGYQGASCGTGHHERGSHAVSCGTKDPGGGTGVGGGSGMLHCGSTGPRRGYQGYSSGTCGTSGGTQSHGPGDTGGGAQSNATGGTGGVNQDFRCGPGATHRTPIHCGMGGSGGGYQGHSCGSGSTGGGNQGFSCGTGGTGGGNQNFSCGQGGTRGGNQGSSCGPGGNQGFSHGTSGTGGGNERYCCEQNLTRGGNQSTTVNQEAGINQACCDYGGTGLGMPDYSCPPKDEIKEPKKESKGFFSCKLERGPGFCPKKAPESACKTHTPCGAAAPIAIGTETGRCGSVRSEGAQVQGKPKGCSNINYTSTEPQSSPAELGKSMFEATIQPTEHQTMPVSQDQLNPEVPYDHSKPIKPEQKLENTHSDTSFDDKHETTPQKNKLGSSSDPIVNLSSDQYQSAYPHQTSNIMEENETLKKSQLVNDPPSLLEQGLCKLLALVRSYNKTPTGGSEEPDIEKDHIPGCPFYDDK